MAREGSSQGRPRKWCVSVSAEAYKDVREAAAEAELSIARLAERIINKGLDDAPAAPVVRDWRVERQGSVVIF